MKKMKKMKKLLAMVLAVVMAVGAVNLPAKEVEAADGTTRTDPIEATTAVRTMTDATQFFLTVEGIELPTQDWYFQPVDSTSVFTFNGEPVDMELKMSPAGLQFPLSEMGVGITEASLGDTVTFGGLWRYADGTFYQFNTTSYIYRGETTSNANLWVEAPSYTSARRATRLLCNCRVHRMARQTYIKIVFLCK